MEKEKRLIYKVCSASAIAVAVFTVLFIILLGCTFDFSEWEGIVNYKNTFRPIQMLTVVPSILLAISYVIFVSGLHIYAWGYKKIWSQLALSFGLLYAGISIANYLIQLVTVIPSIQNGMLEGLALFVSGYSNSIFYALMASYFLMCISLFFAAFVFSKNEKKYNMPDGVLIHENSGVMYRIGDDGEKYALNGDKLNSAGYPILPPLSVTGG